MQESYFNNEWQQKRLDQIAEIIAGQSPPSGSYNSVAEGLPFFQGKAEFTHLHPIPIKWCKSPKKVALPNDILISVRAPVGNVNIADVQCCIGRGLAAIRYPVPKYLFYYLKLIKTQLEGKGTGSTFNAISIGVLKETVIPLPPLPEQHRIVEKIEELFSELDAGIANLKAAREQLKVYRQSVLKWAFEGRLTNEKVKDGELPEGWRWVTIGDICKDVEYGSSAKSDDFGKVPVIRMGNIQNGIINWDELKYSNDEKEIAKYFLKADDVLFNRTNSPELVGKTAIYRGERPAIFAGYLIRIKWIKDSIRPKYLNYFLNSGSARSYGNSVKTDGVNQSNINGQKLKSYPLPLPSLFKQDQVINEIESRFSLADQMEQSIDESIQQAEALRQSVLKSAFEGRLV